MPRFSEHRCNGFNGKFSAKFPRPIAIAVPPVLDFVESFDVDQVDFRWQQYLSLVLIQKVVKKEINVQFCEDSLIK